MKIVQQTPNLLILRLRPVGLWLFGVLCTLIGVILVFFATPAFLFGGIFVISGLVMLMARVVTCIFDKSLNTLTVKRKGFFGKEVIRHELREIKDVLLEESTDAEGSTYRVNIVLLSGDRLPLTSYSSSGRRGKEKTVSCIKSFLNINN